MPPKREKTKETKINFLYFLGAKKQNIEISKSEATNQKLASKKLHKANKIRAEKLSV